MPSLRTPTGTASYPALFAPRMNKKPKPGDEAKYQLTVLFTEEATKTDDFKALQKAALDAAFGKFGDSDKTRDAIKRKAIKMPFITDERVQDGFKCVLRLNSKEAPGVVSRYADPKTGKARIITDPKEIYAGALVRATVSAFTYDVDGNKGVSFGMRHVQKMGDGPRIDGRSSATDDFDGETQPDADLEGKSTSTVSKEDMSDLLG